MKKLWKIDTGFPFFPEHKKVIFIIQCNINNITLIHDFMSQLGLPKYSQISAKAIFLGICESVARRDQLKLVSSDDLILLMSISINQTLESSNISKHSFSFQLEHSAVCPHIRVLGACILELQQQLCISETFELLLTPSTLFWRVRTIYIESS